MRRCCKTETFEWKKAGNRHLPKITWRRTIMCPCEWLCRRMRRNYIWILLIQTTAYAGKIIVHPDPLTSISQLNERAAIGPLSGHFVLGFGVAYCLLWAMVAIWSWRDDLQRARHRQPGTDASTGMG